MTYARRVIKNHRVNTAPLIGNRRPPLTPQGLIERERMEAIRERHRRLFEQPDYAPGMDELYHERNINHG